MFIQFDLPCGSITLSHIHLEAKDLKALPFVCDGISMCMPDAIAAIIKVPSPIQPAPGNVQFENLCNLDDIRIINEIISTIATKNKAYLLWHESQLRKLGDEVQHVHPLKFLSVILADVYLKSCLEKFRHDYFKWHGFYGDLQKALNAHSDLGTVQTYFNDFAKSVGVAPESIRKYADKREWVDMIDYIIAH
jgi:hypothetical protein